MEIWKFGKYRYFVKTKAIVTFLFNHENDCYTFQEVVNFVKT